MSKKIRIGIFGCLRGSSFIKSIFMSGAEVVALCDKHKATLDQVKESFPEVKDVACYSNFDDFIEHDMDAVLLANYFHQHIDFAITALKKGKHVLSETISNVTMADGVRLCRAVEETGMTYALLENYPYFKPNMEMAKVYKSGVLGKIVYAEGEYVHPFDKDEMNGLATGMEHWRNWTPRTYYITHAIAPLMEITDTMPTRVTAMASFAPEVAKGTVLRYGDAAAIIMIQTDNDAVFRISGWAGWGHHGNNYRICGTHGDMEVNKGNGKMRLGFNEWTKPDDVKDAVTEYDMKWPDEELGKFADKAGHGGGDFWVIYKFVKDLENGTEPYWNVYRATATASIAILAWRSILNGNAPYDIPDFRKEEDKLKYENDNASPYPNENLEADIPCSSKPYAPSEDDIAEAELKWFEKSAVLDDYFDMIKID